MWVEIMCSKDRFCEASVILFVRMWVEMFLDVIGMTETMVILFVRMWVEMLIKWNLRRWKDVILFVRMWVEIRTATFNTSPVMSSSSWGCELKYVFIIFHTIYFSHPLREDVSWNDSMSPKDWQEASSSSSWGCELKYFYIPKRNDRLQVILFVRMWVEIFLYFWYLR